MTLNGAERFVSLNPTQMVYSIVVCESWLIDRRSVGWDALVMKCCYLLVILSCVPLGCGADWNRFSIQFDLPGKITHVSDVEINVRQDVTIIEPTSGDCVGWPELLAQIDRADVVLLGELHDHEVGHAIQLAVVEDVMDKYPNSVLALEMLERDEQHIVDDYMEGFINASTLEALTHSENWGAVGGWVAWYQPIIDAVKQRGGAVVAANAPRRYVRLARLEGYERIDELPPSRRGYIDYPKKLSGGRYRERFWEFANHGRVEAEQKVNLTEIDPDDPMLPLFRSQQAWDATMAQSIVSVGPNKNKKVILLVGQFHVEYDGGIVQELRQRMPGAKILVISIRRVVPEDDWRGSPAIADLMLVEDYSQ
jgi:uncharacterized iron-regulated protein